MRVPKLHRHKASQRGFVRTAQHGTHYFPGRWPASAKKPPAEVQAAYLEWLDTWRAEQLAAGGPAAVGDAVALPTAPLPNPSVGEVWERYDERNQAYYRKDGAVTSEPNSIAQACRVVAALFGELPAAQFGPKHLLAVRAEFIKLGWCRTNINDQVSRVRSMFRWAGKVEQSLIPMAVYHSLTEMDPLRRNRCQVPESPKVRVVPWGLVEQTLPLLGLTVQAIVRVHWLLGCRSQDIVRMRPCDLDTSGTVWEYRPLGFKTEHHEHLEPLRYWPGPKAQAILKPLLAACAEPASWVFPCDANRSRVGRYHTSSYRYHVTRAIDAALAAATAELPDMRRWVPRQLRHARLTEIRKLYGVEMAQLVAQHQHLSTTEIYAEPDEEKVRTVMFEIG